MTLKDESDTDFVLPRMYQCKCDSNTVICLLCQAAVKQVKDREFDDQLVNFMTDQVDWFCKSAKGLEAICAVQLQDLIENLNDTLKGSTEKEICQSLKACPNSKSLNKMKAHSLNVAMKSSVDYCKKCKEQMKDDDIIQSVASNLTYKFTQLCEETGSLSTPCNLESTNYVEMVEQTFKRMSPEERCQAIDLCDGTGGSNITVCQLCKWGVEEAKKDKLTDQLADFMEQSSSNLCETFGSLAPICEAEAWAMIRFFENNFKKSSEEKICQMYHACP